MSTAPIQPPRDLRAEMRSGRRLLGTFVKLPAAELLDIVAGVGMDFALIDLEHSQLSEADARALARYAFALGLPAIVRIPEVDRGAINRLLEAGASGIQLSTVRRVSEAQALVRATRYAPEGRRSISLAHPVAGYGARSIAAYLDAQREASPLLVGQIETATTDDSLGAICAAGLDAAFVGVADLSVDMGLPGQYQDERLQARVAEVAAAARAAHIAHGLYANAPQEAMNAFHAGSQYVALSSDLTLLRAAFARLRAEVDFESQGGAS
ncbi:MAG TPA: aldolase/citrate lyase family protein [Ktedonobacterales bacterium]|nr:aldolase/citrate lyase family protein [Ktedonobacterales bacterium]